jgi:hypothetical protein
MTTAYLLFFIAILTFVVSGTVASSLKASTERRILQIVASNIAEAAAIFAAIAGAYSLASLIIMWFIGSSDRTVEQIHRIDEFLKRSREIVERLQLATWWFILALVLVAALNFAGAPKEGGHPLLNRIRSLAVRLASALRGYRKLHKRLIMTLIFAASFTLLPGVSGGDIERVTAARLEHAGKQLADIDDTYRQAAAASLATAIVDRAVGAMPPAYRASIKEFPDGAHWLDQDIARVEKDYRISLEPLHRKVAPLIGRFQQSHRVKSHEDPRSRQDASDKLLAELLASGSDVTFSDLERVSAQVRETASSATHDHLDDVPREIVEEVTGELLNPERLAHGGLTPAFAAMIDNYPWLEPVLEVVSDSVATISAGRPFDAAWRPLVRLFKRDDGAPPLAESIDGRVTELAVLIDPNPDIIGGHGRQVLNLVISDGSVITALAKEANDELARARETLTAANRSRIEELQRQYQPPREETPSPSDEQKLAGIVAATLLMIEEANAAAPDKRDWLEALNAVLPSRDRNQVAGVQQKINRYLDLSEGSRDIGSLIRGPGPSRTPLDTILREREREAIGERFGRGR